MAEVKTLKGTISKEQIDFLQLARWKNYAAICVYGLDEAWEVLSAWANDEILDLQLFLVTHSKGRRK